MKKIFGPHQVTVEEITADPVAQHLASSSGPVSKSMDLVVDLKTNTIKYVVTNKEVHATVYEGD